MARILIALVALLQTPSPAGAHAGHGGLTEPGWLHYIVDPFHAFTALAAAACIVGALRLVGPTLRHGPDRR